MRLELPAEKLRALPVQLIEIDGGVVLKRGRMEIKIVGDTAAESLRRMLGKALEGATREEICELFAEPERLSVVNLIQQLVGRGILVPEAGFTLPDEGEDSLDVFYWHFGLRRREATAELRGQRLRIVGVNAVACHLATSLRRAEAEDVEVLDYPLLRSLAYFDEEGRVRDGQWPAELDSPVEHPGGPDFLDPESLDCLVATSDFGGAELLREWNDYCVLHGLTFLPVVLQDLMGYVGPLVVPGESACFECLRLRQNAHLRDPGAQRAAEAAAFAGQRVSGFHPAMASVLGNVAAFELSKFFTLGPSLSKVGHLIEVNLLAGEMTTRKVLRVPRCPVCSNLQPNPEPALTRTVLFGDPGGSS